jgi:hypothetical protein
VNHDIATVIVGDARAKLAELSAGSVHCCVTARRVFRRDGYQCRLCQSRERLEIHHIDPFSHAPLLVMDIGNVLVLCHQCHKRINHKEMEWRKRLYGLLKGGDVKV